MEASAGALVDARRWLETQLAAVNAALDLLGRLDAAPAPPSSRARRRSPASGPVGGPWVCDVCDPPREFTSAKARAGHANAHRLPAPAVCPAAGCGREFTSAGGLHGHLWRSHGVRGGS